MAEIYSTFGKYKIINEGEKFGINSVSDKTLLPCIYDSIIFEHGGFIITKNSKSGYIKFDENSMPLARILIPCIYERVEAQRNGLVLYRMPNRELFSEKEWFDFKSEKLYRNLSFMKNYGEYDEFLDTDTDGAMPQLKRSGEDFYVVVPFNLSVHILSEIPTLRDGAKYFICAEELADGEAKKKGYGYEYFFLVVLRRSYTFTHPKPEVISLFENFRKTVEFFDTEFMKEKELEEMKKEFEGKI